MTVTQTANNTAGEQAASAGLAADPLRPRYHFLPPANWMNDPNGPIYHNGYYHLFYQHNPFADTWGTMHWGHARSTDLLHWEHLPIALAPAYDKGEQHVYSGTAGVDDQGRVVLIYTSVSWERDGLRLPNQQWGAIGDADLMTFQRHPANPFLAVSTHGGPKVGGEWRDPFLFQEAGRTFLVLGANYDDKQSVLLYEASDGTLAHWQYRGVLYERSESGPRRFLECPNFVRVGDKWILLTSPYRNIEYIVGNFDLATTTFTPEQEGVLDPGRSDVPNFYASNILFDPQGRCILLGWVRGFTPGRGWNGCLALPRVLTIGADNRPRQIPLPEVRQLRIDNAGRANVVLAPGDPLAANGPFSAALEVSLRATPGDAGLALNLVETEGDRQLVEVYYRKGVLTVQNTVAPLDLPAGESLDLQLFFDGSVIEVFANDGRVAVTRIVETPVAALRVECRAEFGNVPVDHFDVWTLEL